ncbi:hypothetical protein BAY61_09100 [Prauserella marina]|uniref:Uncharacterized protein n=1 Tax=Prauserella marina TaxID=530584 RepID=A0A222VN05_9PSEU|nr:hypothetical protein [Prauserella marina]ASR35111.1 hypothetical protein BAY61_09100 [Prauserella marina]PWV85134.1 hypothetical protein DES30_1011157 [Prauserella marina]SDC04000.1 hypothetical protein SAMN05421630_101181 [Prauserella marina]
MNHREAGEPAVREATDRLLTAGRLGDLDTLSPMLGNLIAGVSAQRRLLRPVLGQLVATVVSGLERERAEGSPGWHTVELLDDRDTVVGIDSVRPSLRAVLRAVVAALNSESDDARFQLGLVCTDPDPLARLDAIAHVLAWASDVNDVNRSER